MGASGGTFAETVVQTLKTDDFLSDGWLNNVRLNIHHCDLSNDFRPDGEFFRVNVHVAQGQIAHISPWENNVEQANPQENMLDLEGRVILPCFVDCHTHLDKGFIWPRKPNPDGTFMGALESVQQDRLAYWREEDVHARMDFGLRCAWHHGTRAIRTHLDSLEEQYKISWPVFEALRHSWAGKVDLQAACLFTIDGVADGEWFDDLAKTVAKAKGVLGAVTFMVDGLEDHLDRFFQKADQLGLDVDFHADETHDIHATSLIKIAQAALRNRFQGRILVGHCCSLALQDTDFVKQTLDQCAQAGVEIVSLPMCNLYLQDRRTDHTTPRWRGVTLLHEMRSAGLNVCVASDNVRDPFYAYGDLDMLEVYRMSSRILHLDHPVGNWPATVFENPAKAMGIGADAPFKIGSDANFVIYNARNWNELLSRLQGDRLVVRGGQSVNSNLPDYRELDEYLAQP